TISASRRRHDVAAILVEESPRHQSYLSVVTTGPAQARVLGPREIWRLPSCRYQDCLALRKNGFGNFITRTLQLACKPDRKVRLGPRQRQLAGAFFSELCPQLCP